MYGKEKLCWLTILLNLTSSISVCCRSNVKSLTGWFISVCCRSNVKSYAGWSECSEQSSEYCILEMVKFFVCKHFSSVIIFVGKYFRHLTKILSLLTDKVFTVKVPLASDIEFDDIFKLFKRQKYTTLSLTWHNNKAES